MKANLLRSRLVKLTLIAVLLILSGIVPPEPNQAAAGPFCDLILQTCFAGCDTMCLFASDHLDCFLACSDECCKLCTTAPGTGC